MDTPKWHRYQSLVNDRGPDRPSLLEHPLHAEFVDFCSDTRDLITAAVELSLQNDGTAASAAYAVRLKLMAQSMKEKADGLASILLKKVAKS